LYEKLITTALLLSSGVFIAGQTNASTKTADATFKVKIEVVSTCSINTTDIDFGEVNSGMAATDKTGTLNVTCTSQTPYKVGLSGSCKLNNTADSTSSNEYKLFQESSDTAWDNKDNLYSATG